MVEDFVNRHNGVNGEDIREMLSKIGSNTLDELINEIVPPDIRCGELQLDKEISEYEYLRYIREIAKKNIPARSFIGLGYYSVITPAVIQRNILENPGWYTQYTPYQAEISQGRLEALINFQTVVENLTGLPIANASLLDEGTAAAEAMIMLYNYSRTASKNGNKFFVARDTFPQTIEILKTRSKPLHIELVIGDINSVELSKEFFGLLLQYPNDKGAILDRTDFIQKAKSFDIYIVMAADILALTLIKEPAEYDADVCIGSTQRFGIPMGFGGPHAAFFAAKEEFKRIIPGRIIGASVDVKGNIAYRMALQTREQHIKREKATSNICTSQVLLAIMAGMYAVYHGPEGLKEIAERIHSHTALLNDKLKALDYKLLNECFFDTLYIECPDSQTKRTIINRAAEQGINFRIFKDNHIGISIGETTTLNDLRDIISIFNINNRSGIDVDHQTYSIKRNYCQSFQRSSKYLINKVFNRYHSETELMRYIKSLENRDLSLTQSMIPLGSCTMKLNAAAELYPISFSELGDVHPFAPVEQINGYLEIIDRLGNALLEITGFDGISFQPNSGAQGEYAGLMVIRSYFAAKSESQRDIVLIPASAHGTNPASAVMAGFKVIVVNCDDKGNIDIADLKIKTEKFSDTLAALMVTYPSTHGVYESGIKEVCSIVHQHGGQVYMDGANMNAQVGLTKPALIGADVCHLNLHKTFAVPHGGGGPGMGPICVAKHLLPFLPKHIHYSETDEMLNSVSAAHYGSALILVISLGYIKMLGAGGLKEATKIAMLNANYLKSKLENHYPVLYAGNNGRIAHELIFDLRQFKKTANIEVEDVAKRLMDYGFHAPTVSFPVAGTLMVEPTESESKYELDRFIEAMISIRQEIAEIENGESDKTNNVLKNAPHTAEVIASEWQYPYSRMKAVYPIESLKKRKYWMPVSRINNAFGDRNLMCSCDDIENYREKGNQ